MDDDASVHDRLLWAIHISGFDDLAKFLASAQSEKQWSLHILEIITLMFRDQVSQKNPSKHHICLDLRLPILYVEALQLSAQMPDALVSAGQSRSAEEKLRDSQELESLRQKEHAAKRSRTFQRGTRCNFSWNHSLRITADSLKDHLGFLFSVYTQKCLDVSLSDIPALEARMLYKGSGQLEKMI